MKTLKSVPVHAGSMFEWHDHEGVADASDFKNEISGRVWQDACDVGFWVKSHRTGKERLFLFEAERRDNDGENMASIYVSRRAGEPTLTIVVFND